MKQGKFYKITALFAVCLLVTAMLPLALAVNADGYTPSEKTVPSTVTLTAAVNPNAAVVTSSVEPTPDEPPVPMGETLPAAGLLLAAGCGGAALVSVRRRHR